MSEVLTDLELEMYKEASHTIPYPISRSPGKSELLLTGEIRTSVVSGKTHSTVTSLSTGAMAFFKDLIICWRGSEHRVDECVRRMWANEEIKDGQSMSLRGGGQAGFKQLVQQWTRLLSFLE